MKKTLLTLGLLATILSCSKDDDAIQQDCNCTQDTYEKVLNIYYVNGMPHTGSTYNLLYSEDVGCQDETNGREQLANGLWIEIKCN